MVVGGVAQSVGSPTVGAELDSMVWIPFDWLTKRQGKALLKKLTIHPRSFQGEPRTPIKTYVLDNKRRRLGLPVKFGLEWLRQNGRGRIRPSNIHYSDGFPITVRKLPDPYHEKASPHQDTFFKDMIDASSKYKVFLAEAPTRSGKTPAALNTIGTLLRTALVIVPTRNLATQWVKEITNHLGLEGDEIGLVQGGRCRYEGCSVVIAVIHNLVDVRWEPEFYSYFGIVVWDEVHKVGARTFAESTKQFAAIVRIGMSATPKRKDGCGAVFINYFGKPVVVALSEALACTCYVLDYRRQGPPLSSDIPQGILLNILAKNKGRNELIALTAKTLYDVDRDGILIVSDRIGHLQHLLEMIVETGVPRKVIGLFTRTYVDSGGKTKTATEAQLELVKARSLIILATYGLMKEGQDVPRLDSGIDATPRSEGIQMIGRIRTPLPGKKHPVWFTIRDVGIKSMVRQCRARLRDYRSSNVTVIEHGKKQT